MFPVASLVIALMVVCAQQATGHDRTMTSASTAPLDLGEAMALCDSRPLQPAEGIWEFPDEKMSVMISRSVTLNGNHAPDRYIMTVIDTPDVRLTPGDTVGWLEESGTKGKFVMTLYTRHSVSRLMGPAKLLAELSSDEASFKVKAEKWNLKLSLSPILRNFWRIVKLQHDNPVKNLPASMLRLYPAVYAPGERSRIRYL